MNNYLILKNRIKKNEGYSLKAYKDQLGFYTIGYGHLIKKNENFFFKKIFNQKYFNEVFENDFNITLSHYYNVYKKKKHTKKIKEVYIEMIYQLGIKNQKKFKKMNKHIENKQFYMAALEMIDSLWFTQTPKRVNSLIKILLENEK